MAAEKAAEAKLRSYQTALVAHVTDAIIATTVDGVVTRWNPAAVAADGGVVHATHRAADGSPLPVRVSVTAILDGYALVCSDQSALRRVEQQCQTVVNSLEQGVMVVGRDGRLHCANPTTLRYFGIRAEDVGTIRLPLDVPLYDIDGNVIPVDQRPGVQALRTGAQFTGFINGFDQADGRRVWLLGSSRLLNPDDPQHSPLVISFTHVTAQHTLRQRLTNRPPTTR